MGRVGVSVVIDAPSDDVWADVRDIASHVEWMQDAEAIRFTSPQREGVGTTFLCRTRLGPLRLTDRMEVTEWADGHSVAIRHSGLVTGTGRFTLEPETSGRTRLTWEEDLVLPWWMGGRLGSLVGGQVQRLVIRRNLANLKRRLEAA